MISPAGKHKQTSVYSNVAGNNQPQWPCLHTIVCCMLAGRITRRAQQRAAGRSSALSSASGSLSQAPTPLATSSISTPSSNPDDDIISDDTQSITSFASAGQRRSRHPDDIGDSDAIRDSAERRSKEVIKRYGTLQAQRCAISEDVMNDFTDVSRYKALLPALSLRANDNGPQLIPCPAHFLSLQRRLCSSISRPTCWHLRKDCLQLKMYLYLIAQMSR